MTRDDSTMVRHDAPLSPFAPDVAAEVARWLDHLGAERRMSGKTLDAYARDVRQFLGFLADHLGGAPSLAELAAITPQDVRAFMAWRRGDGVASRSLMRSLAGVRSFAPLPGARRQGQGRRAHGGARAEGGQVPAQAAAGRSRAAHGRRRTCARARTARHGFSRAMPPFWRCSTAAACASPKRYR